VKGHPKPHHYSNNSSIRSTVGVVGSRPPKIRGVIMPAVPRIRRVAPEGSITRPAEGIPVIARIHWHHGVDQDVNATAVGWTREAVEISWEMEAGEGYRTDWIAAVDVRRQGEPPRPQPEVPPHTRAGKPRGRW
jgi:hypothetical protein